MTTSSKQAPDALDKAIDHAIDRLTAVDDLEARSRAQVQRRLLESAPPERARWNRGRRLPTWVTAPALASLLLVASVVVGSFWLLNRPTLVSQVADRQTPRHEGRHPARTTDARPPLVGAPPLAPTARTAAAVPSRELRATSTSRREATRQSQRKSAGRAPDRLAMFLRTLEQLPPDVWERLDTAGPPSVPALDIDEGRPIAPLAVEQLPGTEWPAEGPTDHNPPGDPR